MTVSFARLAGLARLASLLLLYPAETHTTMVHTIFSYGSNSIAQLRARVENPALKAHPGKAVEWQRIFCVRTSTWGGAAASIIPAENCITYGSVVYLEDVELERLDLFEGGYHRQNLEVSVWDGTAWKQEQAIAYIANSLFWTVPPSEAYLTAIHVNLREQFKDIHPECVKQIHVYGVMSVDKDIALYHNNKNKEISHDNGHSDMSSGTLSKENVTSVHDFQSTDYRIESISTWYYPGAPQLSLPALCVEVNAVRTVKWVMPRAVAGVVNELKGFGILSAAHLAAKLAVGWSLEQVHEQQRGSLEYLDSEALDLFRGLLQLDSIISNACITDNVRSAEVFA